MDTGFGPHIIWDLGRSIPKLEFLGTFKITETVTVTWMIMAVLIVFSILSTRNLKKSPGKLQLVLEIMVGAINKLTEQTMGEDKRNFAPYMGTLIIFLAVANLSGLLGITLPTTDVNISAVGGLIPNNPNKLATAKKIISVPI